MTHRQDKHAAAQTRQQHRGCHVLIVGAGLCGTYLALGLRRTLPGVRVVVLDKRVLSPCSTPTVNADQATRAIALAYGSVRFFSRWGLPFPPTTTPREEKTHPPGTGCPVRTVHVSEAGRLGRVCLRAKDWHLPALGYVFPAHSLQHTAEQALHAASMADHTAIASPPPPGLHLHSGATLVAIRPRDAQATPVLASPAISPHANWCVDVQHNGQPITYYPELIVAADGTDSFVATELKQAGDTTWTTPPPIATGIPQLAWVIEVHTTTPSSVCPYTAWERFTPAGPCALLPLSPGRYKCVWTLSQTELAQWENATDSDLLPQLQTLCGHYAGRFLGIGSRTRYPLRQQYRARAYQHGAVWIGNAAHTVHPIAAQGFNMGLRDVEGLMVTLARCWTQGHGLGDTQGLAQYAQSRAADHHWVQQCTQIMNTGYPHPDKRALQQHLSRLRASTLHALSLCPPLMQWGVRPLLGVLPPPVLTPPWTHAT